MKRRTVLFLLVASLAAAVLALVGIATPRIFLRSDVPVYEVRSGRFARQVTAEGTLKAAKATPLTAPMEAQAPLKIAWLAPDSSAVKRGEALVRFDPTDFENRLVEGKGDRATADHKIEKSNAQSAGTRENLRRDAEQATRELQAARTFQRKDAEIFSRSQIIESEIDEKLAGQKKEYSENVRTVRDRLSRAERDLLAIEERKARIKIKQAEQGLGALEVRAPHDGILVLKRDWRGELPRVGQTVWSGQALGEIPDLTSMQAEVFVLEADAGGLAVGQKARVFLESNPRAAYRARVSRVDPLAKPRIRNVPVQYFGVTLELSRTDPTVMKPGARVEASLEIAERAKVISVPLQAVFEKDGKKLVYRRRGSRFEPVAIGVGGSSLGRIVVEKGLAEGDRVALRDPARPRAPQREGKPEAVGLAGTPRSTAP